jgi:hypothetical protein
VAEVIHLMVARKQREIDRKGPGQDLPFKDTPPGSNQGRLSQSHHLPVVSPHWDSINGLNHELISGNTPQTPRRHTTGTSTERYCVNNALGLSHFNQVDNQD